MLENGGASIIIGEKVAIASGTNIYTTSHAYENSQKRSGAAFGKRVVIEDGAWIGGGVIIVPGVTIGKGCIVAAGSVVISDCEPNSLYAGNPAVKKKPLPTAQ